MLLRALASTGEAASSVAEQATNAVKTGLTDVGSQMGNMITAIVPIALGVVAGVIVVKFGIKLFRSLTGRA